MQPDHKKFSAQTDSHFKHSVSRIDEGANVSSLPVLDCKVRQADGKLEKFDILKVARQLKHAMPNIGSDSVQQDQTIVYDVCAKVVDTLIEDMPESAVYNLIDIQLQVEMTLLLSDHVDIAEAFVESLAS